MPIIKNEVHNLAFVLTREEANMGSKKIYEKRFVETNAEQKKLTKQISKDFAYKKEDELWTTKYAPVKYMAMSRVAGGFTPKDSFVSDEKLKEIKSLLEGELREQRVIIWFRFNHELEYVAAELKKKWKVGILMGGTKEGLNEDMTLSKDINVMCAQAKLGKMGLPWYDSSVMFFYSNYYDYEVRAQCEDRGIHPLKKEPYLIIDLISEGTIDEEVVNLHLAPKKKSSKYFMDALEKAWEEKEKCF
jgi:hypothetical protein